MKWLQQLKGRLSEATATVTQDTLRRTWQQLICAELQTKNSYRDNTPIPALEPTQPPIQWVSGTLLLGVNRPEREADHSPSSSVEVKECVELYIHSPIRFHGAVLKLSTGTSLLPIVKKKYIVICKLKLALLFCLIAVIKQAYRCPRKNAWRFLH
jgi:hypothetical protein